MKIDFTKAELSHILTLILDNEESGDYYGNKQNWDKQSKSIKEKIEGTKHK